MSLPRGLEANQSKMPAKMLRLDPGSFQQRSETQRTLSAVYRQFPNSESLLMDL